LLLVFNFSIIRSVGGNVKVLVIGSGGREHAIVWKLAQSSRVRHIYAAPGNGGIGRIASNVNIKAEDTSEIVNFVEKEKIDLTIVGPELPLVNGLVDEFETRGLRIFGPGKKAAQMEGSKVFAKELMARCKVPTAHFKIFDNSRDAKRHIDEAGVPIVIKADGLAQGKGVIVAKTIKEAKDAIDAIMEKKIFGASGNRVVIEECLYGEEVSIMVLTDGESVVPLASSQDHKRVYDNDEGPNTGGMGAYSPAPIADDKLMDEALKKIIRPVIKGMKEEGIRYKGILYAGLMVTEQGPSVLEFNVRFGDPETQVVIPRLKNDLVDVIEAVIDERLEKVKLDWDTRASVCIVLTSGGYPGTYEKGKEIYGIDEVNTIKDVTAFHAGTRWKEDGGNHPFFLTDGGRVLGITALGKDLGCAIEKAYQAVGKVKFEGMHFRKDIGAKALQKVENS
jgi:phosphoribosylamine--glycine ligase